MAERAFSIGHRQADALATLTQALTNLQRACPAEFTAALREEIARVRGWQARIAAVGQVKAGKSTFLSALIGRPGFLPSEVNPWTSVVTNMRFGLPGDPASGAAFHFFDEHAWQRIITGDGDTRRMTEEMLPGFRAEVLTRQTEEMRTRAQRRLGRFYDLLLGTKHQYDVVGREMLERYVCAGPADDADAEQPQGRYAAITQSADIFFPAGDFAVPAIVTDTPGVNDPFLVRDEFTCRSLAESDIFIVTLSAHQALTEVDLALIRMLARHKGKEIIVFVNRIDEIEDYAVNAAHVRADVTARIRSAIPDRDFTLILGSAYWAELALDPDVDPARLRRLAMAPEMERYLAGLGQPVPEDPSRRLVAASGLNAVKRAIAAAIDTAVGPRFLAEETAQSLAVIEALRSIATTQASQLGHRLNDVGGSALGTVQTQLASEEARSRQVAEDLAKLCATTENRAQMALNNSWIALRRDLDMICQSYLEAEASTIAGALSSQAGSQSFDVDLLPLRGQLEDATVAAYGAARDRLDGVVVDAAVQAARMGEEFLDDAGSFFSQDDLPSAEIVPAVPATLQKLTVEASRKGGWSFWRRGADQKRTLEALSRAVMAEIHPATENLIAVFEAGLIERLQTALQRLQLLSRLCTNAIQQNVEQLEAEVKSLENVVDGTELRERLRERLSEDLRELDRRNKLYTDEAERLRGVVRAARRGAA